MRHQRWLWLACTFCMPALSQANPERLILANGVVAEVSDQHGGLNDLHFTDATADDEKRILFDWPKFCVRICNDGEGNPCGNGASCTEDEVYGTDQGIIARDTDIGLDGDTLTQVTLASMPMGDLRLSRKVFGSTTTNAPRKNGYVRHYDAIENLGDAPITLQVRLGTTGVDEGLANPLATIIPRAYASEFIGVSEDASLRVDDRWFSLDDAPDQNPESCPQPGNQQQPCGEYPSAHVIWGGSAVVKPLRVARDFFGEGLAGHLAWDFEPLVLAPGETVAFLTFTIIEDNRYDLLEELLDYVPMHEDYLGLLTPEERSSVVNFAVRENNFGPWSMPSAEQIYIQEGASMTFRGTGSEDSENDALTFTWSFDEDAETIDEECVRRIFSDDGGPGANAKYVALEVTERDRGENALSDTMRLRVVVNNENPWITLLQTTPAVQVNDQESTFDRDVFNVDVDEGESFSIDRIEGQDPGADRLSFEVKWTVDQPFSPIGIAQETPKNLPRSTPECPWPPQNLAVVVNCGTGASGQSQRCAPPAEPWTFEIRGDEQEEPMEYLYPQLLGDTGEYVALVRVLDDDGGVTQVFQEVRVRVHNLPPRIDSFLLNRPSLLEGEVWALSSVFEPTPPFQTAELTFSDPGGDPLTPIGFSLLEADRVSEDVGPDGCLVGLDPESALDQPCLDDEGDPVPGTICATLAADGQFNNGLYRVRFRVRDNAGAVACKDALLTVQNVPPVLEDATLVGTGFEGGLLSVEATASDAGRDDLYYRFEVLGDHPPYPGERDGDDACADSGALLCLDGTGRCDLGRCFGPEPHTVIEGLPEGEHQIRVLVMDQDGSSEEVERTYVVANSPPTARLTLATASGDPLPEDNALVTLSEGDTVRLQCLGSDAGGDELEYGWDLGLGVVQQFTREATFLHTFRDSGLFRVRCEVREVECHLTGACAAGRSGAERSVNVLNAAPVIEGLEVVTEGPLLEGMEVTFRATASDPGGDTLTYLFFFGNGAEPDVTEEDTEGVGSQIGSFTYGNEGAYRVRLQVFDGTDYTELEEWFSVSIENAPPEIRLDAPVRPVREGAEATLTGTVSDPGNDRLTVRWDMVGDGHFEDESSTEGGPIQVTFMAPDDGEVDGRARIRAVVTDTAGAESSAEVILEVENVDPSFNQFNAPAAHENHLYRFAPGAQDPGGHTDPLNYALITPPGDAVIDPLVGMIEWTPTYEEHLSSPVFFIVAVNDDEGGSDSIEFSVEVQVLDEDADGLPDTYETLTCNPLDPQECLDPTSGNDAGADVDGDGRSALEEFDQETSPFAFDGPDTPEPLAPDNGVRLDNLTPALTATPVSSNRDEPVRLEFAVHGDPDDLDESELVVSEGVDVNGVDPVTWRIPEDLLEEDRVYAWRVRAISGPAITPWSDPWTFLTNATNSPPSPPMLLGPSDGGVVDTQTPLLRASLATDPDGDELRYIFTVFWPDEEPASSGLGIVEVPESCEGTSCPPEVSYLSDALAEDTRFTWSVVALDEEGLPSPPSETFSLRIDSTNSAPSPPQWLWPEADDFVDTLTPTLRIEAGEDPEGDATFTVFVVRNDEQEEVLRSPAIAPDDGRAEYTVEVPLTEDRTFIAEAYTIDDRDAISEPVQVSFFVSSRNDPPTPPAPLSPDQDAQIRRDDAILIWEESMDPEGDGIRYVVEYCLEDEGEEHCSESEPQEETAYSLIKTAAAGGVYQWSVRAIDDGGASSEKGPSSRFSLDGETNDVDEGSDEGCGCHFRAGAPPPGVWFFLGCLFLGRRTRYRRKSSGTHG